MTSPTPSHLTRRDAKNALVCRVLDVTKLYGAEFSDLRSSPRWYVLHVANLRFVAGPRLFKQRGALPIS